MFVIFNTKSSRYSRYINTFAALTGVGALFIFIVTKKIDDVTISTTNSTQYASNTTTTTLPTSTSSQPAILPLQPWEIGSMKKRKCRPPKGISRHCCIGSFSMGGSLRWKNHICNYTEKNYKKAEEYATSYLLSQQQEQPLSCDACRIADYLIASRKRLSFVGDSMMSQTHGGFECELTRRGYGVQRTKEPYKKRKGDGCRGWRNCVFSIKRFIVTKPNSNHDAEIAKGNMGEFFAIKLYRPQDSPNQTDVKEVILPLSDIVIFDHGLHWYPTEKDEFADSMKQYLQGYYDSNLTLLAWRETSAQHFDTVGGHYGMPTNTDKCTPKAGGTEQGYRMPIMRSAAQQVGLVWKSIEDTNFSALPLSKNDLVFLPFRKHTLPFHDLHSGAECTHYCHTPNLWLPLWRSIRLAFDQAFLAIPQQ